MTLNELYNEIVTEIQKTDSISQAALDKVCMLFFAGDPNQIDRREFSDNPAQIMLKYLKDNSIPDHHTLELTNETLPSGNEYLSAVSLIPGIGFPGDALSAMTTSCQMASSILVLLDFKLRIDHHLGLTYDKAVRPDETLNEQLQETLAAGEKEGTFNVKSSEHDPVNNPDHYTSGGIECIDYLKAKMTPEEFIGFLKGNVIKYMSRANCKGSTDQDYRKAQWCQNKLIETLDEAA